MQIANKNTDIRSGAKPFSKFERNIAMRYLGAKKKDGGVGLIALLSFLCIFLAIFAMITIMSIMNGFREKMIELSLGLDGHMYVASAAANPAQLQIIGLRDRIRNVEGVKNAFVFTQTMSFVQANNQTAPAKVIGISAEDLMDIKLVSDNLVAGNMDEFGTGHNGGDKIVVGAAFANKFGMTAGDRITIFSPKPKSSPFGFRPVFKSYEIEAVFSTGLQAADEFNIYMPIIQSSLFFESGRAPTDIQLLLDSADMIHDLRPKIRQAAKEPVFIETWEDRNQSMATALRTEQVAMRFIFMIVVLIAVFPILAAMIMLVKNKSKDIAILKTIGATSGSVLRIFLMAGATIGILGTIAGVLAGLLLCLNIDHVQSALEWIISTISGKPYKLFPPEIYGIDNIPAKVVPSEVLSVAFWGFLVATFATFFPARNASKIDPVEALRYE